MTTLSYTPLTADRLADYLVFFQSRAFVDNPRWAGCYCYFPLHDPARTEWSRRTAPENRAAVTACIEAGSARGVLAYQDGEVVGHPGPPGSAASGRCAAARRRAAAGR